MRPPEHPEVRAWLDKAKQDLRASEVLSEQAPDLEDAICFHCQQAAEKLLKAVLVALERNPPRTHDLEELAALLTPPPSLPGEVDDALLYLTQMAVIPRYPVRSWSRASDRVPKARAGVAAIQSWIENTYGWRL